MRTYDTHVAHGPGPNCMKWQGTVSILYQVMLSNFGSWMVNICLIIVVYSADKHTGFIAGHHLLWSGMEPLIDKLNPLPCGVLPKCRSARWSLNCVHHAMYAEGHKYLLQAKYVAYASDSQDDGTIHRELSSSLKVSMKSDEQSNNWFNIIPHIIISDLTQPLLTFIRP